MDREGHKEVEIQQDLQEREALGDRTANWTLACGVFPPGCVMLPQNVCHDGGRATVSSTLELRVRGEFISPRYRYSMSISWCGKSHLDAHPTGKEIAVK